MRLFVERALKPRRKPLWLGIWHSRQIIRLGRPDLLLLARDLTDTQALVLRLEEHLVAVEGEEDRGCVLASDVGVEENPRASGVQAGEFGQVVHIRVDDDPEVAGLVVLL